MFFTQVRRRNIFWVATPLASTTPCLNLNRDTSAFFLEREKPIPVRR